MSLEELCRSRVALCRQSFDEASDDVRGRLARGGDWGTSAAEIGTCDGYRFIAANGIERGNKAFYDASGRLIGGQEGADRNLDRCDVRIYGDVPECAPVVTETIRATRR